MTKSQISLLGSLLAASALAVAGCGGGSSGGGVGGHADSGAGGATTATGGRGTGGGTPGTGGATTDAGGDVHADTGGGDADAGVVHLVNYTFDTTDQGWTLNNFDSGGNIAGQSILDGGMLDGGVVPTLAVDTTVGNPAPGSLKMTGTFTAYNQALTANINFASKDLTGKTLHAKVMLMSGTWPGYAVISASSTSNYLYDAKGYNGLSAGTWTDLAFDLSTATTANWTAAQVVQIAVQIGTGAPPVDASVTFAAPLPVVVYLDTVTD